MPPKQNFSGSVMGSFCWTEDLVSAYPRHTLLGKNRRLFIASLDR